MAERANRTLKERLYRYFAAHHTYNWVGVLQRIVSAINRSPCSSLGGLCPNDVTFGNAHRVRQSLMNQVELNQRKHPALRRVRFHVGDRVRIEQHKHVFQKGYHPNFTNEVFEVAEVRHAHLLPITYRLRDRSGEILRGWFYANDLCRVNMLKLVDGNKMQQHRRKKNGEPIERDKNGDPVYAIERILKRRTRDGQRQCLVRWRGYGPEHDSWIPAKSLISIRE